MARVPSWVGVALDIAEAKALNRATVDWPAVRAHVNAEAQIRLAAGQPSAVLGPMFRALGDGHSFLDVPAERPARPAGGAGPVPTYTIHERGIGCLVLPGVRATDFHPSAAHPYIEAGLRCRDRVRAAGSAPLVVDLRENGGGNCFLMFLVLAPLLGVGRLVAWEDDDGLRWVTYDGEAVWTAEGGRFPAPAPVADAPGPVAVLIGPQTGSSGEAVALALLGRPNACLFGAPTAGLTTANTMYPLPGGGRLNLAVARMVAYDGRRADGPITPDVLVNATDALETAVGWLS